MRVLIICLLALTCTTLRGQTGAKLERMEEVTDQAKAELKRAMESPEGKLYLFGKKRHIVGEYTLQLTIRNKGEVVSVYVADRKGGDISSQNILKDKLLDFQFSFRLPKNKDYKLSYTFNF
ncbi:MAG: hypothetical protein LWW85_10070 [Marinilabiliales bacterium]|nr:hypothetical protein [Marinilabiliales bacterium]